MSQRALGARLRQRPRQSPPWNPALERVEVLSWRLRGSVLGGPRRTQHCGRWRMPIRAPQTSPATDRRPRTEAARRTRPKERPSRRQSRGRSRTPAYFAERQSATSFPAPGNGVPVDVVGGERPPRRHRWPQQRARHHQVVLPPPLLRAEEGQEAGHPQLRRQRTTYKTRSFLLRLRPKAARLRKPHSALSPFGCRDNRPRSRAQ